MAFGCLLVLVVFSIGGRRPLSIPSPSPHQHTTPHQTHTIRYPVESVATMRTIIDAAEGWMERNPIMMEKRIMRNIERVRACVGRGVWGRGFGWLMCVYVCCIAPFRADLRGISRDIVRSPQTSSLSLPAPRPKRNSYISPMRTCPPPSTTRPPPPPCRPLSG